MTELRFARALYAGEAVDAALQRFADHAAVERQATDEYWIVRVTAHREGLQRRLCGELGNHALALTVARGGPEPDPSPDPAAPELPDSSDGGGG